jgi:hypothetical protein
MLIYVVISAVCFDGSNQYKLQYLNVATFTKDLLSTFIYLFCPVVWRKYMNMQATDISLCLLLDKLSYWHIIQLLVSVYDIYGFEHLSSRG